MITINTDHPDLMKVEREDLEQLVADTNEKLRVGNIGPLQLSVESLTGEGLFDVREVESRQFDAWVEQAEAAGDPDLAENLRALKASRARRALLLDDLAAQLEEILP